jgi:porphobilinogen synthase
MQDVSLLPEDLIAPIFVHDKKNNESIPDMPFTQRYGFTGLLKHCEELVAAQIQAVALFPVINEDLKTQDCKAAYDEQGLIARAIKTIKKNFPNLVIIADVALDAFNPQGQDGLLNEQGEIDNDRTLPLLAEQALCYAHAGADIVAPSDMMDGRVQFIRQALEQRGLIQTLILSYAVKFSSHLYGPFRSAIDSARFLGTADKKTYQMDYRSRFQTFLEIQNDQQEQADILLIKPGLHYLDIIHQVSQNSLLPVWSYHVSGECAMLYHAAQNGVGLFDDLLLEALFAQKRAGARKIITYFALKGADLIKNSF